MENIKNQGGGENLNFTLNPAFLLQDMSIDFFDFQFIMNANWTVKETRFKNQIIDPEIWAWLFLIKEKYFKKVKQHKLDRKKIESHKAEKERMINARKQKEHNYQWHIKFCERACGEQKRLLLAIWMIAHNQKRMNEN